MELHFFLEILQFWSCAVKRQSGDPNKARWKGFERVVCCHSRPHCFRNALLYFSIAMSAKLSFKDLFLKLGEFVHDPHRRWDYCMRAKRGQTDTSQPGSVVIFCRFANVPPRMHCDCFDRCCVQMFSENVFFRPKLERRAREPKKYSKALVV